MITERLFYSPETDEVVIMKVYSDDDSALWTFEFDDGVEGYTFSIHAALSLLSGLEEVGDL